MFVRELSTPRRMVFSLVAVAALASAGICGFLALTEPQLPTLARIGLGIGSLFGLAWAAMASRLCWRGTLDLQVDSRRIASMVWVFTVLMMVFFLLVGMSLDDRQTGTMMILCGLAFLVGAAVYWINYRIEQVELTTREHLLRVELRLSELRDKNS